MIYVSVIQSDMMSVGEYANTMCTMEICSATFTSTKTRNNSDCLSLFLRYWYIRKSHLSTDHGARALPQTTASISTNFAINLKPFAFLD